MKASNDRTEAVTECSNLLTSHCDATHRLADASNDDAVLKPNDFNSMRHGDTYRTESIGLVALFSS